MFVCNFCIVWVTLTVVSQAKWHTHNYFMAVFFSGLPRWAGARRKSSRLLWCSGGWQKQTHRPCSWVPLHRD